MKTLNLLYLSIFLLFNTFVFGQDKNVDFTEEEFPNQKKELTKALANIKEGDVYFYQGDPFSLETALTYYVKADSFNPYNTELNYKMGISYLYSSTKYKATPHLEYAYKYKGKDNLIEDISFYLGQAYQLDARWDDAIEKYNEYLSTLSDSDTDQQRLTNKKISECSTGKELYTNPTRVWIENIGDQINTKYPEYGPVISADNKKLFFTSRRPDTDGGESDDSGFYFEDIYYTEKQEDGSWSEAKNIGEPVNTEFHDATIGLAPDGKTLLTYYGTKNRTGNILVTKMDEKGEWIESTNIGENINTKYHESSATLSFDEKTLFFVSDRPGGYGEHDIYISHWDEEAQEWGLPENVGPTINTEYDERGVFFHPDNKTMYFSSSGHNTMGGLDIFKTTFNVETGEWSEPENIGAPINTPDDDVYYVVTGNEKFAYYSSVKSGGYGEKDIYVITFLGDFKEPLLADFDPNKIKMDGSDITSFYDKTSFIIIKGMVTDGKTKQPINEALLTVTDVKSGEVLYKLNTGSNGVYMVPVNAGSVYSITASAEDYTMANQKLTTTNSDEEKTYVVNLDLYAPNENDEFVLEDIYFNFDKYSLRNKSQSDLDHLVNIMKQYPTMTIELAGHTDTRGSVNHNSWLSRKRAEVAKQYLVDHGIEADRITAKGYGESQPVISDSEIKSLSSKEEKEAAHQKNRRTVVKIITK